MNGVIIVCVILFTAAVIVATVYFVITMIQLTRTAKKAEEALTKINYEMDTVGRISTSVLNSLGFISKSWINVATAVLPVFMSLIFKNKK